MYFFIQVIILLHANFVSLFQQPADNGSFRNETKTDTNLHFFMEDTYMDYNQNKKFIKGQKHL